MQNFDSVAVRIVPVPKEVKPLQGTLKRASRFVITAPEAPFGPVKTAGERIRRLLCSAEGDTVQVTLRTEQAPRELPIPDEGYRLTVTPDAVDIVGFGEKGLLYGVITLEQLFREDDEIPAMEVFDWPESKFRGIKEECRYGSNLMEREEWMALLEDIASKKMNALCLAFYGCWTIQYDGRISEFLYMPIKNYPEIQTPMVVKYYDPREERWVEYEQLPPIFRDNLLDDICRRARDLGIQIIPTWNSYGHNTLLPRMIPEISPVDENGVRQGYGFCTSNPKTYEVLFGIYDQIINDYMKPYGFDSINLSLDEVHEGIGRNTEDIYMVCNPWCQCPECRRKEKIDLLIGHIIKLVGYLKSKGIKNVIIAGDMLQANRRSKLGDIRNELIQALRKNDLQDTLLVDWWSYHNIASKSWIKTLDPELGLRGIVAPWNGYHTWSITCQPLGNARILAEVNHRDSGEGMIAYSMWDRACDRTHDAIAEYVWGFRQTGSEKELTARYARRHFPGRERQAYRAYRLMDYAMEQRHTTKWSMPEKDTISNLDLLTYRLSPYNFSYVQKGMEYPRAFLDEGLKFLHTMREDAERALYTVSTMSLEAESIFLDLAETPGCDRDMALRQAYECGNYRTLAEDWLAILEMQDLCLSRQYEAVAHIAQNRRAARLALMAMCQQVKERCIAEAMAMRQHSIFLQLFRDIADHAQKQAAQPWDLMDIRNILSERSFWLR